MVNDTRNTGNTSPTLKEPPAPEWGTVQEAADRTGLSGMTIRRYGRAGRLPTRRKGPRLIEVDLSALDNIYAPLEGAEVTAGPGA